jgi:hypothetical protein
MFKNPTQLLAHVLIRATRFRPVQVWLHQLATAYKRTQTQDTPTAGFDIPEITPIHPRAGATSDKPRLNLLVPAVSQKHVFGGIETSLQVFELIRQHFGSVRIVVTDESVPEPKSGAYYSAWPIVTLRQEAPNENHIVVAGDRWNQTLELHANDYFMVTAWWTAHAALDILDWQRQQYPQIQSRRLLYFIQDFEPGFYPWSSRYVLAQATYNPSQKIIAVINSSWLQTFLHDQGHFFFREYVHQPSLHPVLALARNRRTFFRKERQLLVYGRPGTDRNAFPIVVAALRLWVQRYPAARHWKILSAGEDFSAIDLGLGCQLQSLGKVSIETYAELLSSTAVGLSLMISPHPSYPPLEMAAFGVRVVTNQFANKNLASVSSYLSTIEHPDPDKLATQLVVLSANFDALAPDARLLDRFQIDWHDDFLQPGANAWAWTTEAAKELLST